MVHESIQFLLESNEGREHGRVGNLLESREMNFQTSIYLIHSQMQK